MRSTISQFVEPQTYNDILQNHKKFLLMPAAELIVDPLEGDVLKLSRKNIAGHIYRVVTLVEKVDVLVKGDAGLFALSLRPLGKAEKEEMRA